jgi:hypothetical protein
MATALGCSSPGTATSVTPGAGKGVGEGVGDAEGVGDGEGVALGWRSSTGSKTRDGPWLALMVQPRQRPRP